MSRRVITAVNFDLKADVTDTPPHITVLFTDVDDAGKESHGHTTFRDDAARTLFPAGLLDAVNAAIGAQADDVREPGTVTARITAANEAHVAMLNDQYASKVEIAAKEAALLEKLAANIARNAAMTDAIRIGEENEARRVEAVRLDAEIAAKLAEVARLAAEIP